MEWVPWVSNVLACDGGILYNCGSSSYGTAASACQGVKGFYCPSGATSWKTAAVAADSCQGACTYLGKTWALGTLLSGTGGRCCQTGDNFLTETTSCESGQAKACGTGVSCGYKSTLGNYWCNTNSNKFVSSQWFLRTSAGLSDDSSTACCDAGSDCVKSSVCYDNLVTTTHNTKVYKCNSGTWMLNDSEACSANGDCYSGYCKSDYDGVGKFCAPSDKCVHDGAVYDAGSTICKDGCWQVSCNQGFWSENNCCSAAQETDGGDKPLIGGKVVPAGTCTGGSCSSAGEQLDSCSGATLTERYLSGTTTQSKSYDCTGFNGCWFDGSKKVYNESSCTTETYGYCSVIHSSLNTLAKCTGCQFVWFPSVSKCCDDSGNDFVGTYTEVNKACDGGVVKTCTTCGQTVDIGGTNYYCDGSSWKTTRSYDACRGMCEPTYVWFTGTLIGTGGPCCNSGTDGFHNTTRACEDGVPKRCGYDVSCGGYVTIGSTNYYCDSTQKKYVNSQTYSKISNLDSTSACCDALTDCVLSSVFPGTPCYNNGQPELYNNKNYRCTQGDWKLDFKEACTENTQCASGRCIADFSGGSYCTPADQCPHKGATVEFYSLGGNLCKDSALQETCTSSGWSATSCSEPSESDGGNKPLVAGKVVPPSTCSSTTGTCTSPSEQKDSCSGSELREYYLSGPSLSVNAQTYQCSSWQGCWDKRYNVSSCTTSSDGWGHCNVQQKDLDDSSFLTYCAQCGFDTVSTRCCGDDVQEYYRVSNIDSTKACCSTETDCTYGSTCRLQGNEVTHNGGKYKCQTGSWYWQCNNTAYKCYSTTDCCSGSCASSWAGSKACCASGDCWDGLACVRSGAKKENERYLCSAGAWYDAYPDCSAILAGSWYYALGNKWVSAGPANASCQNACEALSGVWQAGTVVQGFRCCLSSSKESRISLSGDQALCDGASWKKASQNSGTILLSNYVSTGTEWKRCISIGQEVVVGSATYLCTESGWQNKVCGQQGDLYQSTCTSCGGMWVALGGEKNCCGDDATDEFEISSTELCDGVSGVQKCDMTCKKVVLGVTDYYCFGNFWAQNALFSGETLLEYGGSSGCCGDSDCWNSGCFDTGYKSGGTLCSSGSWLTCMELNLCSSESTTAGNYYCGDNGWTPTQEQFCQGLSGLCLNETCKLCGTDYQVGEPVGGYLCTSSGIFSSGCITDSDCLSTNECRAGTCVAGSCVYESLKCGTPCSSGICDGSGTCLSTSGEGESCACNEVCSTGLYCGQGGCKVSETCGDSVCQVGECSACPDDCSTADCAGDGSCSYELGETCANSEDCSCGGKYCDTSSAFADVWGCVASACGNGICEAGECSYCMSDCSVAQCSGNGKCDVILGETCDNSVDCSCQVKVNVDAVPVLRLGESGRLKMTVENQGNAPMVFNLDLQAEGLDIEGGTQKLYLSPNEIRDVYLDVTPTTLGEKKITVFAKSSQGDIEAGEVRIHVKSLTFWENFLVWFKSLPFYNLFEASQIVLAIMGAMWAFFKVFIPKKKPKSHYMQVPGYYYGSQYQQAYPGYPQQYRRR